MKKRLTALLVAVCMIVMMMPMAGATDTLTPDWKVTGTDTTATTLTYGTAYTGTASFSSDSGTEASDYTVEVKKGGAATTGITGAVTKTAASATEATLTITVANTTGFGNDYTVTVKKSGESDAIATASVTIAKKTLDASDVKLVTGSPSQAVGENTFTYNNDAKTVAVAGKTLTLTSGTDYDVNPGTLAAEYQTTATNAGDYKVKVVPKGNYTGDAFDLTWKIKKADVQITNTASLVVGDPALDLTTLVKGLDNAALETGANPTFELVSDSNTYVTLASDGKTLTAKAAGEAKIKVTTTATTNYNAHTANGEGDITVTVTAAANGQTITTSTTAISGTYGTAITNSAVNATLAGFGSEPASVTLEWQKYNGTAWIDSAVPTGVNVTGDSALSTHVFALKVSTNASTTPAGQYRFRVIGADTAATVRSGYVTLTIAKAAQTPSYATKTITKNTGDASFTNALTRGTGDGTVTYTSSDTDVATVAADGTVTIKAVGVTTITAKAAATDNFNEATAAYTLTVNGAAGVYRVTFDANEGKVKMTSADTEKDSVSAVTANKKLSALPLDPTRSGYTFDGWYTAKTGGTKVNVTTSYEFSAHTTLYAQWTKVNEKTYKIKVEKNISKAGTVDVDEEAEKGKTVTVTIKPKTGYDLDSIDVYWTRNNDKSVKITEKSAKTGYKYTFKMPDEKVTVDVVFKDKSAASVTPSISPSTTPATTPTTTPTTPTTTPSYGFGYDLTPAPETSNKLTPYYDVHAGSWYENAVLYVTTNRIMYGTGYGFEPNASLNRAMLAQVLYNLDGSTGTYSSTKFGDVKKGQWYTNAVGWASAKGVMNGASSSRFNPTTNVTREQLAVTLFNYAKSRGVDVSGTASLAGYPDGGSVSGWATQAMQWAVSKGLLSGTSSGALSPKGNATRGQIAKVITDFSQNVLRAR